MPIIDHPTYKSLLRNGMENSRRRKAGQPPIDYAPVAKLILPGGQMTFLLTEILLPDLMCAFGLIETDQGEPHLGSINLIDIDRIRSRNGERIMQDLSFRTSLPLIHFVLLAKAHGRIAS